MLTTTRQAIIAILQKAGEPLTTFEIHRQLVQARGVTQNFQIQPIPPVVRIGPARWGLNDRDVAIKLPEQPKLIDLMIRTLDRQATGIHITELRKRLRDLPDITAESVFSIASQDSRLRVSSSQYLYLTNWGEPRRETLTQAVNNVMKTAVQSLTLSEVLLSSR